ncbi:MAG: AIR carboxylase family protein, partial [Bryobacteraceae bacterium]
MDAKPLVAVVMGSKSDWETMRQSQEILTRFEVPHEIRVLSAHRTPAETAEYAARAEERGIEVVIAAAGGAAHLAGVIAAHTILPVLGVPIESPALK